MTLIALFVSLIGLAMSIVLAGLGIGLGIVLGAVLVMVISVGIGVATGRFQFGLRAFLVQIGMLTGAPAGAVTLWLVLLLMNRVGHAFPVLVIGSMAGALAGLGLSLSLDLLVRRIAERVNFPWSRRFRGPYEETIRSGVRMPSSVAF